MRRKHVLSGEVDWIGLSVERTNLTLSPPPPPPVALSDMANGHGRNVWNGHRQTYACSSISDSSSPIFWASDCNSVRYRWNTIGTSCGAILGGGLELLAVAVALGGIARWMLLLVEVGGAPIIKSIF